MYEKLFRTFSSQDRISSATAEIYDGQIAQCFQKEIEDRPPDQLTDQTTTTPGSYTVTIIWGQTVLLAVRVRFKNFVWVYLCILTTYVFLVWLIEDPPLELKKKIFKCME